MINKKYKKLVISLILLFSFFNFSPILAAAPNTGSYNFVKNSGLESTGDKAGYDANLKNLTPTNTISKMVKIILTILGIIFIGLIIYGGLIWILSAGNEQQIDKAKKVITGAIIGLIIVLAAYALTYFVVQYFSSKSLKTP